MQHTKRLFCLFLSTVILSTLIVVEAYAFSGTGSGTQALPYIITTPAQLDEIRNSLKAYYKLGNDLDMNGIAFQPIGDAKSKFAGNFDGGGYKIKNLTINAYSDYVGLFGYTNNATISNVVMENIYIQSTLSYVGGLVGYMQGGTVQSCYINSGSVKGSTYIGGLIGSSGGKVSKSGTFVDTTATRSTAGGLIGSGDGITVSECYAKGDVMCTTMSGGLIGYLVTGSLSECYANGNVQSSVTSGYQVGGLIGCSKTSQIISNCYATGNVTGHLSVGGLIGANSTGTVQNCYAVGSVTGVGASGITSPVTSLKNCFFDQEVMKLTSPSNQAKTTAQMYQQSTYTGWNFSTIWKMDGYSYPTLQKLEKSYADKPKAPEGLNCKERTDTTISVAWLPVDGATKYNVTIDGTTYETTDTKHLFTGLNGNTQYTVTVVAMNDSLVGPAGAPLSVYTLLPTITEMSAEAVAQDSVMLSWPVLQGASQYEVRIGETIFKTSEHTLTITELVLNTEYEAQIRAVNSVTESEWSAILPFRMTALPLSVPKNIKYIAKTDTSLTLSWNAEADAVRYDIEVGEQIYETEEAVIKIEGLIQDTVYHIRVRCSDGTRESKWSEPLDVSTLPTPLLVPDNLALAGSTHNSISLTWDAVADAAHYEISYGGQVLQADRNAATIDGLSAEMTYSFMVRALNSKTESEWSEPMTVSTGVTPLLTPGNISITGRTESSISLTWEAVPGATEYAVKYNKESVIVTGLFTELTGLSPNTVYEIGVRSGNSKTTSNWNELLSVLTKDIPLDVPQNLKATSIRDTSVHLEWSSVNRATGYEITYGDTILNSTETKLVVQGLLPEQNYHFKVRGTHENAEGKWNSPLELATAENLGTGTSTNPYRYSTKNSLPLCKIICLRIISWRMILI